MSFPDAAFREWMRGPVMIFLSMRHSRIFVDCRVLVRFTILLIAEGVSEELSARAKTWAAAPSSVPNSVPRHVLIGLIHMIKGGPMKLSRKVISAASPAAVRAPATHTVTTGTIVAEDY